MINVAHKRAKSTNQRGHVTLTYRIPHNQEMGQVTLHSSYQYTGNVMSLRYKAWTPINSSAGLS